MVHTQNKNSTIISVQSQNVQLLGNDEPKAEKKTKKAFVEPEISIPVDVLKSTTFFQIIESGQTN